VKLRLLLLAALIAASPVPAQDPLSDPETRSFVLGNVQFVLLHELAHLVIQEKGVPIIGPEETAADYIAATVLILGDRMDDAARERAIASVLATAEAFALSWQMGTELGSQVHYWSAHALSVQRYHQVICLLYGSNPEVFNDLPGRVGMPNPSKLACSTEFARAAHGTQWLLRSFGRRDGAPAGAPVTIRYEEADTIISRRLMEEVRNARILEKTMEQFTERFALEQPMQVVMRRCRRAESAWIAERRELVVCHELLEGLYQLSLHRQSAVALLHEH
jgi:urease gamma subunit